MKRFMLFRGRNYYPSGGIDDLVGNYDTIDEAILVAKSEIMKDYEYQKFAYDDEKEYFNYEKDNTWGHIYDTLKMEKTWEQSELQY